jgi:tetratricopeptide (TPR) repeat protein
VRTPHNCRMTPAADRALAEAVTLFNAGRAADALQRCQQALTTAPRHAGLRQLQATLLLAHGDAAGALAAIEPVLVLHPDHAPSLRLAAEAALRHAVQLTDECRPVEAMPLLTTLTRRQPTFTPAWFALSLVYEDLHLPADAADALRQVLAHEPAHVEAWLNLGLVEQCLGHLEVALDCHAQAWALRPALLGRIAMALCSQRSGAVWLDAGALEAELRARSAAAA